MLFPLKVRSVALWTRNHPVIPEEFIVDGFDVIKDPRGIDWRSSWIICEHDYRSKTIVHNIKRCIDKAGLNIEEMVIQPLKRLARQH